MPKIYESPDGGITIREREFGNYDNTITVSSGSMNSGSVSTITNTGFGEHANITLTSTSSDGFTGNHNRAELVKKYPELTEAWEKYKEIEKHYVAWEELNKE